MDGFFTLWSQNRRSESDSDLIGVRVGVRKLEFEFDLIGAQF